MLFIINFLLFTSMISNGRAISNNCGLQIELVTSNRVSSFVRCTDTTGLSNPSWKINNISDYQHQGLGQLRLFGQSFTVLSLRWAALPRGQAEVQCSSNRENNIGDSQCSLSLVVTQDGIAQPRDVGSERPITTTTTLPTTTRRSTRGTGSVFFPGQTTTRR